MTKYALYPEGIDEKDEYVRKLECDFIAPGIDRYSRTYLVISGYIKPSVLRTNPDRLVPVADLP